MRIAFDIDDTLYKLVEDTEPRINGVGAMCACGTPLRQEVDSSMIDFVQSLVGTNEIVFWSAGGIEHVQNFIHEFAQRLCKRVQQMEDSQTGRSICRKTPASPIRKEVISISQLP